jgi:hypothetical protein
MLITETAEVEKFLRQVHGTYGARIARRLRTEINALPGEIFLPDAELRRVLREASPESLTEIEDLQTIRFRK